MDTTTALTIIAPNEFHDKINQIRSKFDRAYPRWMPHINLYFPFVPEDKFDDICNALCSLKEFGEFEINMNKLGYFSQKKIATIHIEPTDASKLHELYDKIKYLLTSNKIDISTKHDSFHPHLTIAQCKKSEIDEYMNTISNWFGSGFKFKIDKIFLIKRHGDTPFEIKKEILLRSG